MADPTPQKDSSTTALAPPDPAPPAPATFVHGAQPALLTMVSVTMPGGAVYLQPHLTVLPGEYPCASAGHWMYRPPGELPPLPAPTSPGQWILWCNGNLTWLAAPATT